MTPPSPNQQKARAVRLLCLDVDGTLTDGRLVSASHGFIRNYHVLDGFGVQQFIRAGGIVAIVSAATEGLDEIRTRARQMKAHHVHLELSDKLATVQALIKAEHLSPQQVAFMGDDAFDIPALRHVGFACVPCSAHASALQAADYITAAHGGAGAVREVCDFILKAQGKLD